MAEHGMTLMSMLRPKKGAAGSEMAMPAGTEAEGPRYSYGLVIRLEDHELEKLKLRGLPEVGTKVRIEAAGVVETVHESQSMHNQGERNVSIQITDLALKLNGRAGEEGY